MTKEGRTNGLKVGRFGPRVYYTLGPNRPTSSPSWVDPKNLELGWLGYETKSKSKLSFGSENGDLQT